MKKSKLYNLYCDGEWIGQLTGRFAFTTRLRAWWNTCRALRRVLHPFAYTVGEVTWTRTL